MTGEPPHVELLRFRVDDDVYGVETEYVREIDDDEGATTPVPGSPDAVEGVREVRGEVTVVVDARTLFGDGNAAPDRGLPPGVGGGSLVETRSELRTDQLVVLDGGRGRPTALLVDSVEGVTTVPVDRERVEAAPGSETALDGTAVGETPAERRGLKAVLEDDGTTVRVVDVEGIPRAVTRRLTEG